VKEATAPRVEFLKKARTGTTSVNYYPPAKWAAEKGYATVVKGKWGGETYTITPAGEDFLKRAGYA